MRSESPIPNNGQSRQRSKQDIESQPGSQQRKKMKLWHKARAISMSFSTECGIWGKEGVRKIKSEHQRTRFASSKSGTRLRIIIPKTEMSETSLKNLDDWKCDRELKTYILGKIKKNEEKLSKFLNERRLDDLLDTFRKKVYFSGESNGWVFNESEQ